MSYAMVTLFAGAFPFAAALALAANGLEGRLDTFKILRCRQRPMPEAAASTVGVWTFILQVVSFISIACNAYMVAKTSTSLPRWLQYDVGEGDYGLVLVIEHLLLAAALLANGAVADVPARAIQTMARQRKLLDLIIAARGKLAGVVPRHHSASGTADFELEEDSQDEDERVDQRKASSMTDAGLLRSFKPAAEKEEVSRRWRSSRRI